MIAAQGNVWHGHGVSNFRPLAEYRTQNWLDLKEALLALICKQILPKKTFETVLNNFRDGTWSQSDKQTVAEFEGELFSMLDKLRQAVEHDNLEQSNMIPCKSDIHAMFIGKVAASVKATGHDLLSERRAGMLMRADLGYANGRFEGLTEGYFLELMLISEDINRRKAAAQAENLGQTEPKAPRTGYQKHNGGSTDRPFAETSWQRQESKLELGVRCAGTMVTNMGDLDALQALLGTEYQNTAEGYQLVKGTWRALV